MEIGSAIAIIHELIRGYGFWGLVVGLMFVSFLTTLIPVPMDLIVLYAVEKGFDPFTVALAAALGTTLAACIDYFIGYGGSAWISSRINREKFERTHGWLERWGIIAIFFASFLPVPFEIVAVVVGVLRMGFYRFLAATLLGKLLKYAAFAYFGSIILDIAEASLKSLIG